VRPPGGWLALAPWIAVGLLVGQAFLSLVREPCLGVADNLDYWRVARPAGIEVAPQPRQGMFVVCTYPETTADLSSAPSIPAALAWIARAWGPAVGTPPGRFHLRQLGLLYLLLTAAVVAVALVKGAPRLPVVAATWVVLDPGFLLFFHSLYGDPAAIVGLSSALCGVWLLRREPDWGAGLCLVGAVLVGFSRMQFAPFPLLLLIVRGLHHLRPFQRPTRRQLACGAALAFLGVAAPAHFLWGAGPRFPDANAYNAVFGGIARVASEPAAALANLGIPHEHRERGTADYFEAKVGPDDPVLPVLRRISRLKLAASYASDWAALDKTTAAIELDLRRRATHARGNYTREESAGKRREFRSATSFSAARARLLTLAPRRSVLIFLLILVAWLTTQWFRAGWNAGDLGLALLVAWLGAQAGVAVLGEGFVNLHQHLLGARLALDLCLALVAVRGITGVVHFAKKRRASETSAAPALQSSVLTSPADPILRRAIARTLDAPAPERRRLFTELVAEIVAFMAAHPEERPWTCTVFTGTDGSAIFRGGVGHSLVIDPQGGLWRARSYEDFETAFRFVGGTCEIATLTPKYEEMRECLQ
jgi:hypothetical protein